MKGHLYKQRYLFRTIIETICIFVLMLKLKGIFALKAMVFNLS